MQVFEVKKVKAKICNLNDLSGLQYWVIGTIGFRNIT